MLRSASRSLIRRTRVSCNASRGSSARTLTTVRYGCGNRNERGHPRSLLRTALSATTSCRRYFSDYPAHFRIDMPALSPTMESGNRKGMETGWKQGENRVETR